MSAWVAETLVATTLLMALVLVVRVPVRRMFGAGAAYALWLVPGLRLILPPLDLFPETAMPIASQPVEIVMAASSSAPAGVVWLLPVWATGAVLFAGWHALAYRRFLVRALMNAAPLAEPDKVLSTRAVQGPAAVGLLTPRILVPLDFESRFDAAERALSLRHERVHHARGDLWANAAALGVLGLHWFNPLAHWAYRAFREDQELSCDAAVIATAKPDDRAAYGAAMVKAAWGAAPVTTCPMTRTANLKRRLKMVKTHRKSALASIGGALTLGLTALGGITLTATSGYAQEPVVKDVIIKRVNGPDAAKVMSEAEVDARCGGNAAKFDAEPTTDDSGKKRATKFILCRQDGKASTPASQLSALKATREKMLTSTELDATRRTRVVAAIDSAIARLQAAK